MKKISCVLIVLLLLGSIPVLAQDTPTTPGGIGSLLKPPTTTTPTEIEAESQIFVAGNYQLTIPADWITWQRDAYASTDLAAQALIEMIAKIDPVSAEELGPDLKSMVPIMAGAALSPKLTSNGYLISVRVVEYGYQASLADFSLTTNSTPDALITALGITPEIVNGLSAGFQLDTESQVPSYLYIGIYAVPELDRLILAAAETNAAGWTENQQVLESIIKSFQVVENPEVPPTQATPQIETDCSSLPTLAVQGVYPYQYTGVVTTGSIDLTTLNINPSLEKVEGTTYYPPVIGYVSDEPTFAFCTTPTKNVGVVFVSPNLVDTVMLVQGPDGSLFFADDVKTNTTDPAVATNLSLAGVYRVWIGTKYPNQQINGELYILIE